MPPAPRRAAAAGVRAPRCSWTTPYSSLTPSGPTSTCTDRAGGRQRATSSRSTLSTPVLRANRTPTRSLRNRRTANASAPADAGSSHWTSSIARSSGRVSASPRSAFSRAMPTACGSGGGPSSSPRTSARESARFCPSGRGASASSSTGWRRSPSAQNVSATSLSAGLASRTRSDCSPANATPSDHRVVFPIPASPSSTSAAAPSETLSTSARIAESSASRPTTPAME